MKVTGSAVLHAPRDKVWQALNDPAVLVRTIPGCHQLEAVGPDAYRMTLSAGVASIKGTYQGDVRLSDQQEPESFLMRASGAGGPGTISADVIVRLAEESDGVTRLDYDADAVVGGMIGGVGQRVLAGVAKKTAGSSSRRSTTSSPVSPQPHWPRYQRLVAATRRRCSSGSRQPVWPSPAARSCRARCSAR